MIRLAVAGAGGRMGSRIVALATRDSRFDVVAALDMASDPRIGQDVGELSGLGRTGTPLQDHTETEFDVLIDFTRPEGTVHWLDYCLTYHRALVVGTTGHTREQLARVEAAAQKIPLLKASNMSVAMNVMFGLVGQVAATLGDDYDIEIVESHHRFKADAPSGTAVTLRDSILRATGRDAERDCVYGRRGDTGQRPPRQIGIHALRVGDTIGEHEVQFGSLGETLTIRHSAHTRDTFVLGALRAAAWLVGKPPGLYNMQHVLGFVQ